MRNNVEKLIQDLRSLSPIDRREVLTAMNEALAQEAAAPSLDAAADEGYQRMLIDAGLISEVRLRPRNQRSFEHFQPVAITGEPLSQTVIEERR